MQQPRLWCTNENIIVTTIKKINGQCTDVEYRHMLWVSIATLKSIYLRDICTYVN